MKPRTVPAASLVAVVMATVLATSCGISAPTTPHQPDNVLGERIAAASEPLEGRQVWAHSIEHGLPEYREIPGRNHYGAQYPLDLVPGGHGSPRRPGAGVQRAQEAGLTGIQVMQFEGHDSGTAFVGEWMDQADGTWSNATPDDDFSVAPTILASSADGTVRMIDEYLELARTRPSAAAVDGRYVVFVYGTGSMPPEQWRRVREQIDSAGRPVFLVGDLQTDASQHNFTVDASRLDSYVNYFDAVWNFEDSGHRIQDQLVSYLASRGTPYAGGLMPGYNRETSGGEGFVDAHGTALFRRNWENALATGAPWQNVVTWNDAVENTDIKPSSNWNVTRAHVNAFYAAQQRGVAQPRPGPELYVTTPDHVRAGEQVRAEALVLHGGRSGEAVQVHVQLRDGSGAPVGEQASASVQAGQARDATTDVTVPTGHLPAGRFVRAHAWTTDAAGQQVQGVVSAPIVIYEANEPDRTEPQRTHYYSVPASAALPEEVRLELNGSPVDGPAVATVTAGGSPKRFMEVLQNTRQADLGFDVAELSVSVPMKPREIIGGQRIAADAAGFYVGRVIDDDGRVGYSDPIHVSDPRG